MGRSDCWGAGCGGDDGPASVFVGWRGAGRGDADSGGRECASMARSMGEMVVGGKDGRDGEQQQGGPFSLEPPLSRSAWLHMT